MKYLFYTLPFLLIAQQAAAVNTDKSTPGWSTITTYISWTGTDVKSEMQGIPFPVETIYSGNSDSAGNVAFTCYVKSYSVNIATKPVDMLDITRNGGGTKRAKMKQPNIKINGEKIKKTDWIYLPQFGVYRARRKSTSAKIYNAVIRGDMVEVKGKGGYIPLNLPATDKAFKEFGSNCGLGVLAKKLI